MKKLPLLAIDSGIEIFERERAGWAKRGFELERADNMTEGIQKLMINEYILVVINGNEIDFMPLLKTMRDMTDTPIFIITNKFTIQEQVDALGNGADVYERRSNHTEDNIVAMLAHLTRYGERSKTSRVAVRVIAYRDLLVAPLQRCVFVGSQQIDLTRREFDILRLLAEHRGRVFTHKQIFRKVWGEEYEDASKNTLWVAITRLRSKLQLRREGVEYIESVRDVGYRFPA